MRQLLKNQGLGLDPHFHYRGMNQTRVETFSDAAFALAITLLVLSSSVPETYDELRNSMRLIVPFGISVTLLTVIWYQHYVFFLKYGLQNAFIITINSVLIFLILVYVYPLKFLSRFLFEYALAIFTQDFTVLKVGFGQPSFDNMQFLMTIYGVGAALIFFVLSIMYGYAYKKAKQLELTEYERFITRSGLITNILLGAIPTLSVLFFLIGFGNASVTLFISGFTYFLYPIVMPVYGFYMSKQFRRRFPEMKK